MQFCPTRFFRKHIAYLGVENTYKYQAKIKNFLSQKSKIFQRDSAVCHGSFQHKAHNLEKC